MVTLADCRTLVPECDGDGGNPFNITTAAGSKLYDEDCTCFDGNGSTITTVPLLFELLGANATVNTFAPTTTGAPTSPSSAPSSPTSPAPTAPTPSSAPTARQSILLFMPDDMPFMWPEAPANPGTAVTYDTTLVPSMNRIRSEGVTFTSASVAGPKCAPARFNLMTGRYCSRGVYAKAQIGRGGATSRVTVQVPTCKIDGIDNTMTMARTLQSVGYRTIMSGKYHLLPAATGGDWWANYSGVAAGVNATGFTDDGGIFQSNMDNTLNFTHNLEWTTSLSRAAMADAVADNAPFFL
jgi:hypothetical protein